MSYVYFWKKHVPSLWGVLLLWGIYTTFTALPLLWAFACVLLLPVFWFTVMALSHSADNMIYRRLNSLQCNLYGWSVLATYVGGGFTGLLFACVSHTAPAFFVGLLVGWVFWLSLTYLIYGLMALFAPDTR